MERTFNKWSSCTVPSPFIPISSSCLHQLLSRALSLQLVWYPTSLSITPNYCICSHTAGLLPLHTHLLHQVVCAPPSLCHSILSHHILLLLIICSLSDNKPHANNNLPTVNTVAGTSTITQSGFSPPSPGCFPRPTQ